MYIFYNILKSGNALLAIGILLYSIILVCVYSFFEKMNKRKIHCFLAMVPSLFVIIHFVCNRLHGNQGIVMTVFQLYLFLYIEALFPLVCVFFKKKKWLRIILRTVVIVGTFAACTMFIINLTSVSSVHNYTTLSWGESFEQTISVLKDEYVLKDWKKIDFDRLESEYLPRIVAAEEENDEGLYGAILTEFAYKCYDGHVYVSMDDELREKTKKYLAGNDYGFSMFQLDSGDVVAVCVDKNSKAYSAGIRNGTKIVNWNGDSIEIAVGAVKCIYPYLSFPVSENEDKFRAMFLAGKGDTEITVSFVDENGRKQTVRLQAQGSYVERLDQALNKFLSINISNDNFSTKMLDDKCGYIRISRESYRTVLDVVAVERKGYYPELTNYYNDLLENLCAKGMEYLIVDLRNNTGGYNCVAAAFASLFTDEKQISCAFGEEKDASYVITDKEYIYPDGRWKNLPVIILVNQNCMSAGDGFAYMMSKYDNVAIAGITTSNGVNQNNGGYCFLSDNKAVLAYPNYLTLSENGEPLIDTDFSRKTNIPLDLKIPMDEKAVRMVFDSDVDYELAYILEYMKDYK